MQSLLLHLDPSQLNCLNEAQGHTMKEMLKSSSAFLESDADEQLILNIIVRKLFGKSTSRPI